jgi:hypothetical protein
MYKIRLTPLLRFLLIFSIVAAGTAVNPQAAKADAKPGWIVSCTFSHSLPDDPIVAFRQPGGSHMHDFVGATTTDAFSTFESLRAGGTTCAVPGDKSSYWVPALYEDGVQIPPQSNSGNNVFYYRKIGAPAGTVVQPIPAGLRIIIGNARAASPQENTALGTGIVFRCGPGEEGSDALPYPPASCASGMMVISFNFPNCWDGVNLDSVDHRSHMSYPVSGRCPASHPVNIPRLESFFRYVVGTGPIGALSLASGPYYTAHQDFFNGWHPNAIQSLVTTCINAGRDCGINPPLPPGTLTSNISGTTGVGGVTLSYMDGAPRTVTSSGNGSYTLTVSDNWSGVVTATNACFTFSPDTMSFSNVLANQSNQNFSPSFNSSAGCADIDVSIGGAGQGRLGVPDGASTRTGFAGVDNGPVKIESTNGMNILAALRVIWREPGFRASYSEMMGLPKEQLSTEYWFPWYNNAVPASLDQGFRIGNVSSAPTAIEVWVGTSRIDSFNLNPGDSTRVSYDVDNGPIRVVCADCSGSAKIIAALRVIWKEPGSRFSYSEMMGLPKEQLSSEYWFPWYNNATPASMDQGFRIANVSSTESNTVEVWVGTTQLDTLTLEAGASTRVSYNVDNGPIRIVCTTCSDSDNDDKIIAALRVIWKEPGFRASYSEMMGLPKEQLSSEYWFPWYNNAVPASMDQGFRIANVSPTESNTVEVWVGATKLATIPLAAGASTRVAYSIDNGPLRIVCTTCTNTDYDQILAALRVIWKEPGFRASYSEMMGLPAQGLSTEYWFPWYNFAAPGSMDQGFRVAAP